jgi:hypothetical protein
MACGKFWDYPSRSGWPARPNVVLTIVKRWREKRKTIAWAKAQGACATADGAVVGPSWGRHRAESCQSQSTVTVGSNAGQEWAPGEQGRSRLQGQHFAHYYDPVASDLV